MEAWIAGAIAGAVTGIMASVVGPLVGWGIERQRSRVAYLKEMLEHWRAAS